MQIKFIGFDPFIRQLRADKGWRITIEVPQSEYDKIKELPGFQDQELRITIDDQGGKDK